MTDTQLLQEALAEIARLTNLLDRALNLLEQADRKKRAEKKKGWS